MSDQHERTGAKRRRSEMEEDLDTDEMHRRGQQEAVSHGLEHGPNVTTQLYLAITARHNLVHIPQEQFVGLCAYLYAILSAGYPADISDMDRFVVIYPIFLDELHRLETQRVLDPTVKLPAYHQWYADHRLEFSIMPVGNIIDEAGLRKIWEENPYTFLYARMSLEFIADTVRRQQSVPPVDSRTPTGDDTTFDHLT